MSKRDNLHKKLTDKKAAQPTTLRLAKPGSWEDRLEKLAQQRDRTKGPKVQPGSVEFQKNYKALQEQFGTNNPRKYPSKPAAPKLTDKLKDKLAVVQARSGNRKDATAQLMREADPATLRGIAKNVRSNNPKAARELLAAAKDKESRPGGWTPFKDQAPGTGKPSTTWLATQTPAHKANDARLAGLDMQTEKQRVDLFTKALQTGKHHKTGKPLTDTQRRTLEDAVKGSQQRHDAAKKRAKAEDKAEDKYRDREDKAYERKTRGSQASKGGGGSHHSNNQPRDDEGKWTD